ncbi:MAG TPA: indolepyruvate ferredoxin oxidoreductase subunit alpha [Candidatus Faecivicinus avistercoris]|nr:indolepyruvate ferredoxin oxidoreductase subunit alpha [Candidatus Faecivicinus avistercoris]
MKKLMLGNAAVARGLYEAGCRFVSSYPGTPSTEITEEVTQYGEIYAEWAPNEKVAMEAAIGASLAGARSFCAMKHVGMNVAADPMFTASYTGVNAGLLIAVADDPGMHSSQNEQDSRHYAIAAKLPMLEPSDSAECLAFVKAAYEISEKFDVPAVLRTCTRVAHSQSAVELSPRADIPLKDYVKDAQKYVAAPANAVKRHVAVEARMRALAEFAETTGLNREEMGDSEIGFVTSGTSYLYVREVFPNASVFKLGLVNPLPVESLRAFSEKVKKLIVVEELDGVIEAHLRANGIRVDGGKDRFGLLGELSQSRLREAMGVEQPESATFDEPVPARPPVMCPGCPHRGLFTVLSKMKLTVLGDIGCYTLGSSAPLAAIDAVVCMGASIGMAHGFTKVRPDAARRAVAIIGDSTFMHSGMTGVVNVAYNKGVSTVIVLDNAITGMTGHQQNPTTGLTLQQEPTVAIRIEDVCRAAGIQRVRVVDPQDMRAVEAALKEELAVDEPSVIIARRPCMLLKYVKPNPPLAVDPAKCVGCKACMRIGCPAISFRNGKAGIDETMCVGCGLCEQMCRVGAFQKKEA